MELTDEEKEKLMTVYKNIQYSYNYINGNKERLKIHEDEGIRNVRKTLYVTLKILGNILDKKD